MMTKNLQRKIKNTGLILSLVFGFLLMSNVTINAQYGNDDYYRRQEQRQRQAQRQARREQRREQRRIERDNGYYGNNGGYNRNDGYYGNGGYSNNVYRYAQQNGYRDGLNKGTEEASRNKRYNPQGTSTYKNATNGYEGRYGNKDAYKQAYRQAFLDGYDRGYNQNSRYGNRNGRYNRNSAGSIIERIIRGY
jgi:hypothetical protein